MVDVHVEQINRTYHKLAEWAKKNSTAMLMLCVNRKHWDNGIGLFKDTYPCYADNTTVRYYYGLLRKLENPIGLHVHIARNPEIENVPYTQQYDAIKFGKEFLEELGIEVKDFTPGWWSFNKDTIEACIELDIDTFRIRMDMTPPNISGITFKNVNAIHDYELAYAPDEIW